VSDIDSYCTGAQRLFVSGPNLNKQPTASSRILGCWAGVVCRLAVLFFNSAETILTKEVCSQRGVTIQNLNNICIFSFQTLVQSTRYYSYWWFGVKLSFIIFAANLISSDWPKVYQKKNR